MQRACACDEGLAREGLACTASAAARRQLTAAPLPPWRGQGGGGGMLWQGVFHARARGPTLAAAGVGAVVFHARGRGPPGGVTAGGTPSALERNA
eukprot:327797-Chlamydomonas_euryale.AAC.1